MVCSPEISQMNGAKSRGAVTEKGKAIASRNAMKHGLLARKPPLLITEDLTTFEELVQGLIDYYQPESPIEHFLIQQVAMGMLKQYRLWNVEAAIANIEILAVQRAAKFPDVVTSPKLKFDSLNDYQEQRTPLKELLQKQRGILERLIYDLDYDLAHLEERSKAEMRLSLQRFALSKVTITKTELLRFINIRMNFTNGYAKPASNPGRRTKLIYQK